MENHTKVKAAAVIPLPYDFLAKLIGRKVTVFLSVNQEELCGVLRSVDEEKGDLFLEEVTHFSWSATARNINGEFACTGGGQKAVVRKCDSMLVSSKFINGISPTVFNSEPST
ncbi:hypothetical protein ADEAN_000645000 [Angomonas deanei]|uniref:LSM domain containing protein n=1 Tax=Angomonas deanei TaxID=59799 RepID=A0A7G2CIS7_9TRYP|nr:hypothetical protein ADEAN_000645000 [Angomonas deanei]